MAERPDHDHVFKLVLVGDWRVGKTSIINSFTCGRFDEPTYACNIGVYFEVKTVNIADKTVKLQLWEMVGSRYRGITTAYYRSAHGVMIVYDVTDEKTFDNATNEWMASIDDCAPSSVVKMIVGNKCDLEESRVVSRERGQLVADDLGAMFGEISAKSGHNVDQVFIDLTRAILSEAT